MTRFAHAPYFHDISGTGPKAEACWLHASDGVRLRMAAWRPDTLSRGTVLVLAGRTEYVEKYHHTACAMLEFGYAVISLDWRGQGLSDRLLPDRSVGYVKRFADYQLDLAAVTEAANSPDFPAPWYLLGHSMGGTIGLRAVMEGMSVAGCAFTAPMWGICLPRILRPFAHLVPALATSIGLGNEPVPLTSHENYVFVSRFQDNRLTRDPGMYEMIRSHLRAHPDLSVGGASNRWLAEALRETQRLTQLPSPDLPCLTFLGEREAIVDPASVHNRMHRWPRGRLELIKDAEHEVLLERPEIRDRVHRMLDEHFSAHRSETRH